MTAALDRKALDSWLALLAGRGGSLLLGAGILLVAGRSLDERDLWVLLLHLASFGFTGLLATAGVLTVVVRAIASGADSRRTLRGAAARVRARGALAALVFLAVAHAFGHLQDPWLVACALWHGTLPWTLAAAPTLAAGDTRALAKAELFGRCVSLVGSLAMAPTNVGAGGMLFAILAGQGAGNLRLVLRLSQAARRDLVLRPFELCRPTRAEWVVGLGDLVRAGYLHGSHWLVAWMCGAAYVSFGSAMRLFALVLVVPSALSTAIFGPLARGPIAERRAEIARRMPLLLGLGVAVALLLAGPAPYWIGCFFPHVSEPVEAARTLRILALSVPALFGAGVALPFLLARGGEAEVLRVSLAGLLTLLLTLALAWPLQAPEAGAGALVLCEWVVFALASHRMAQRLPVRAEADA